MQTNQNSQQDANDILLSKKKPRNILIIIGIVAVVAIIFLLFGLLAPSTSANTMDNRDLTTLSKSTFQSIISASGTVQSNETYNVYSPIANAQVENIFVEVGDIVHEGMNLVQLNTEALNESYSDKQAAIAKAAELNAINIKAAQDAYNEAKAAIDTGTNTSINTALNNLNSAQKSYDEALAAHNLANEQHANSATLLQNYDILVTNAKAALDAQQAIVDAELAAEPIKPDDYNAIIYDTTGLYTDAQKIDAMNNLNLLMLRLQPAKDTLAVLQSEYASAVINRDNAYTAANTQLESTQKTLDSATTALSNAQLSYKNALDSANSSLDNLLKTLQTTIINADQTQDYNDLQDIQDDIEAATITAQNSGVVTSISAVEGAGVSGVIMVIEKDDSLIVTTSIDEYDINNIFIGMVVEITSNSTGDELYTGSVISIAPSPIATNASGTQTQAEYEIKVKINNENTSLKLGMNARVDFITAQENNVITVPFDALFTDENGQISVLIYTQNEDGTFSVTPQAVQTGSESDFEQVISGENINEGVVVLNNANEYYTNMQNGGEQSQQSADMFMVRGGPM